MKNDLRSDHPQIQKQVFYNFLKCHPTTEGQTKLDVGNLSPRLITKIAGNFRIPECFFIDNIDSLMNNQLEPPQTIKIYNKLWKHSWT